GRKSVQYRGQRNGHARAAADGAVDVESAANVPQDRAANRETQTAAGLLRREERLLNERQVVLGNAAATVLDLHPHIAFLLLGADRYRAAVGHCVAGVGE